MEDRLIPKTIGKNIKSKWWNQFSNRAFRLTKGFFWDLAISGIIIDLQNELWGHGYRFREFQFSDNVYNIRAPFPYQNGGGFSERGNRNNRKTGIHEFMAMNISGQESTRILSNTIIKKWIFSDSIHFKEALLSVRAFNKSTYATLLLPEIPGGANNDIVSYLININRYYGNGTIASFELTRNHLRKRSLINFLNPFIGFAFLSGIENYGWLGKTYSKLYWLKIGKVKYLPSFRMGLTPFGDEVYFESFIKTANPIDPQKMRAARIYIRHGNPVFEKFNGIGIETFNFSNFSNKLIVDFNMDLWMQPDMEIGGDQKTMISSGKEGLGGLIKCNLQIRLWDDPRPVFISTQIGFKSNGYIEGESLTKGLIFRLGCSYDL